MVRARGVAMLAAGSAAAIWGGMYVVSKVVLEVVPPLTLVAVRLVIAAVILGVAVAVAVVGRTGGGRRGVGRGRLLLNGVVGFGLSLGAQFAGTRLSTAHDAALITSATPAFMAVFAVPLLGERPTLRRWFATAVATAGVLVVALGGGKAAAGGGEDAPIAPLGNALLLVAAVTWALYTVMVKASMGGGGVTPLVVTFYATLGGLLAVAPAVPLEWALERPPDWGAVSGAVWLGVLYLGAVSTAVAFYLWNRAFETLDASFGALFFFVQPVVGALLGWLLLGERLGAAFFLGAAAIAAGVLLASDVRLGARAAARRQRAAPAQMGRS